MMRRSRTSSVVRTMLELRKDFGPGAQRWGIISADAYHLIILKPPERDLCVYP